MEGTLSTLSLCQDTVDHNLHHLPIVIIHRKHPRNRNHNHVHNAVPHSLLQHLRSMVHLQGKPTTLTHASHKSFSDASDETNGATCFCQQSPALSAHLPHVLQ